MLLRRVCHELIKVYVMFKSVDDQEVWHIQKQ